VTTEPITLDEVREQLRHLPINEKRELCGVSVKRCSLNTWQVEGRGRPTSLDIAVLLFDTLRRIRRT